MSTKMLSFEQTQEQNKIRNTSRISSQCHVNDDAMTVIANEVRNRLFHINNLSGYMNC